MDWIIQYIIEIAIAIMFIGGSYADSSLWKFILYTLAFMTMNALIDYATKKKQQK